MPYVYSPGFDDMVLAMDYNFWVKFNGGDRAAGHRPGAAAEGHAATYDYMYDQAYNGNRAPMLIANHFNKWNGDSFNPPALDFMQDKCGQTDTYCTTYSGRDRLDGDCRTRRCSPALQDLPAVATGPLTARPRAAPPPRIVRGSVGPWTSDRG